MADAKQISSDKPSTEHKLYSERKYERRVIRDCVAGPTKIKIGQDLYLPIPDGMLIDTTQQTRNFNKLNDSLKSNELPYNHSNKPYQAYLQRARFPEITGFTLRGLNGTATRKPIEVKNLSNRLSHLEEDATADGMSLQELFSYCVSEVLQGGNVALVVDIDPDENKVYFVPYDAESIINWRFQEGSTTELAMVALKTIEDSLGDNKFQVEEVPVVLVYDWDFEEGNKDTLKVKQTRYVNDNEPEDDAEVFPSLQGNQFEKIPVSFIGAIENTPIPQTSPLSGVAEICISIYRKDADLSHAQYMTCNPNLVISGVDAQNPNLEGDEGEGTKQSGIPNIVGSTVALILEDPQAKAYYTNTDTSALDHVEKSIENLKEEALMLGASLVGTAKKAAEKVETMKLRQSAQGATLIDVVRNVTKGINDALAIADQITGGSGSEIYASTEFAERQLSPEMINALGNAVLREGISRKTFLMNMKDAGFLFEQDIEDEIKQIIQESDAMNGRDEDDILDDEEDQE